MASETPDIETREERLGGTDKELTKSVKRLSELDGQFADAEQAFERSRNAVAELAAFSGAGVEKLNRASSDLHRWRQFAKAALELEGDLDIAIDSVAAVALPEIEASVENLSKDAGIAELESELWAHWNRVRASVHSAKNELSAARVVTRSITDAVEAQEQGVRVQVNQELATRGLDGARINQFQALNVQASLLGSYEAKSQPNTRCADFGKEFI